jgi:methylmalonyl-CoA mutase C-terminal domain/subunit
MSEQQQPAGERTIRVLLAKPGLDGHDRGVHVIASALRDAGFEVIYTGLRQTPESIVRAALQEDVDAIGLSVLSGGHMTQFRKVLELMRSQGLEDVLLFGGGIIPAKDVAQLKALGVGELFGPGTPLETIIDYLRSNVRERREEAILYPAQRPLPAGGRAVFAALRTASIASGLPIAVIMVVVCYSLVKALRTEPIHIAAREGEPPPPDDPYGTRDRDEGASAAPDD